MLIDSHCHPDSQEFAHDAGAVLQRAAAAGVDGLVAIAGLDFAAACHPPQGLKIWATLGIHPHDAAAATDAGWERMRQQAADPLVIGIGEIGLDYFYDHAPRQRQREVLERQLQLAAEVGLPVSLHCRDAFPDCLAAIAMQNPPARGVFHCFTGGREEAERALDLGWYLSFSGMLTFARADGLRDAAAWAPAERLLIETDAPFLAPVPHRGKRNEPAFLAATARCLSELRGLGEAQAAQLTRDNFFRLFPRALCSDNVSWPPTRTLSI